MTSTIIREWELVLTWSIEHRKDKEADLARRKIAELKDRKVRTDQPPVLHTDRLRSRFQAVNTARKNNLDHRAAMFPGILGPMRYRVRAGCDD